jgi:hypothetical protein
VTRAGDVTDPEPLALPLKLGRRGWTWRLAFIVGLATAWAWHLGLNMRPSFFDVALLGALILTILMALLEGWAPLIDIREDGLRVCHGRTRRLRWVPREHVGGLVHRRSDDTLRLRILDEGGLLELPSYRLTHRERSRLVDTLTRYPTRARRRPRGASASAQRGAAA